MAKKRRTDSLENDDAPRGNGEYLLRKHKKGTARGERGGDLPRS